METSNTELLRQTIDNLLNLDRRGVVPHLIADECEKQLAGILVEEERRVEEIATSEQPDEHDPEEPKL